MADDILDSMRGRREDMRQRLLQSSEYRALEALDAAIDTIGAILQGAPSVAALAPVVSEIEVAPPQDAGESRHAAPPAREVAAPPTPAARHHAIAAAFAETLAAKLDPRNGARAATAYQPARHTHLE